MLNMKDLIMRKWLPHRFMDLLFYNFVLTLECMPTYSKCLQENSVSCDTSRSITPLRLLLLWLHHFFLNYRACFNLCGVPFIVVSRNHMESLPKLSVEDHNMTRCETKKSPWTTRLKNLWWLLSIIDFQFHYNNILEYQQWSGRND